MWNQNVTALQLQLIWTCTYLLYFTLSCAGRILYSTAVKDMALAGPHPACISSRPLRRCMVAARDLVSRLPLHNTKSVTVMTVP